MPKPLVSVLIPAYNQGQYLVQAVESAFDQTYRPIQVVVVNDGSTDQTDQIAQELQHSHPNLVYLSQKNQGVCQAMAAAFAEANGEYVVRLDADDYLPENYLSCLLDCLEAAGPAVAYAYCDAQYVGERQGVMEAGDFSLGRLVQENYIHVSALVRAAVIREVGYYNPNMCYGFEDWDLWLSLAEADYRGTYCSGTFLYYRQKAEGGRNDMQATRHRQMRQQVYANHPKIYRKPINQLRVFGWRLKRRARRILTGK